jgi:HSP20 family protein
MTLVRFNNRECMPARHFNRETGELFNYFWNTMDHGYGYSVPAANILEKDDKFEIEMLTPGLDKSDFRIKVEDNILEITYEDNSKESASKDYRYSRREFGIRPFSRRFRLSNWVDSDHIQASYDKGILRIEIPKKEEAKAKPVREISIN